LIPTIIQSHTVVEAEVGKGWSCSIVLPLAFGYGFHSWWGGVNEERPQVHSRLPVAGIVNAADVEVVAVVFSQGGTGGILNTFTHRME
jgi:hypothetical protein